MKTLSDFDFNGRSALSALVENSDYGSLAQIVASLSLFSHPETVLQTKCLPLIHVIRNAAKRGSIDYFDGKLVGFDDNKSPTDVFLWCNNIKKRPVESQFNHIYSDSLNSSNYTCLSNLCMTPAFLAKLTDTDVEIRRLLRFRAFDLYNWHPIDAEKPAKPENYESLCWAPLLSPVCDVASIFVNTLLRRPRDRTVIFARKLGHVFNGFVPE